MVCRLVVSSILAVSTAASAQSLPGTGDDPAELLRIWPAAVDMPLGGFAVRGGTEADTVVLVDGFEVPRLQHFGIRSIIPSAMIADGALRTAPDVSLGRAPSAVTLSLRTSEQRTMLDANTFDVGGRTRFFGAGALAVRMATPALSVPERLGHPYYFDSQLGVEKTLATRWRISGGWVFSDDDLFLLRPFARMTYSRDRWRGSLAVSPMLVLDHATGETDLRKRSHDRLAIDTRGEIVRTAREAAGLTNVEWRLGEQTNITRHTLDIAWPLESREGSPRQQHIGDAEIAQRFAGTIWTPDAALWTSVAANLAPHVRATAGLRADLFGRGGDLATQPRGELLIGLSSATRLALAAGAYRRPPQQVDELQVKSLNPERTTQVMARVGHEHRALVVQTSAYYLERSRLVIRDQQGNLANTGVGTAYGVELSAQLQRRKWLAWITASLSRARRRDILPATERPAELDQPIRATAMVSRALGRWRFGARVQLASGLPVTSIEQTIYDADRDAYEPIFGRVYDQRMPFRYEIDLRIDRAIRLTRTARLHAFADLGLSTSTLGYHYSFDYKQRAAITLPIVPFVGVRGEL